MSSARSGVFSGSLWWRTDDADTHARQESRIMHRRVRDTESPGYLRLWFQAGTDDEKDDRDNNGVIDAIQDTTELMDELARKGFRRGLDMVYTQVEGGEHNQATWGFILPYFLRWTFPTQRYVQQHPFDGRDFLVGADEGQARSVQPAHASGGAAMCKRSVSCASQVAIKDSRVAARDDSRLTKSICVIPSRDTRRVLREFRIKGELMPQLPHRTILCITSYEKGQAFMREAKRQGSTVYLLTVEKLRDADWPRDQLDEIFYMPSLFNEQDMIYAVSYRGAHPPARSDCGARRLRRGNGGLPARASAHPRHGRHHRALLPRQTGDARARAGSRHPRAGLRARAQLR